VNTMKRLLRKVKAPQLLVGLLLSLSLLAGCAGAPAQNPYMLTGAGLGAATGAALGIAANHRIRGKERPLVACWAAHWVVWVVRFMGVRLTRPPIISRPPPTIRHPATARLRPATMLRRRATAMRSQRRDTINDCCFPGGKMVAHAWQGIIVALMSLSLLMAAPPALMSHRRSLGGGLGAIAGAAIGNRNPWAGP